MFTDFLTFPKLKLLKVFVPSNSLPEFTFSLWEKKKKESKRILTYWEYKAVILITLETVFLK